MRPPLPASRALVEGIACALGAGLLWGLVFVVPLMLPDYPPAMLSFGRYLGFGVIALLLAWADLPRLQRLQRAGLADGFRTGAGRQHPLLPLPLGGDPAGRRPLPTMLIGTLPIVIAIVANFGSEALPWRRLLPSLAGDRDRHRAGEQP
jgi:drug/metabolite transporter (DMT)-like permease